MHIKTFVQLVDRRILENYANMNIKTNYQYISFQNSIFSCIVVLHIFSELPASYAATHHRRERDADGSYGSRDKQHKSEDGDDNRFDHEAILGKIVECHRTKIHIRYKKLQKISLRANLKPNNYSGSKMEVEEFNHLSPEVAKERLRRLATKMDRNLDGKMDKSELQVKLESPSFVLHILINLSLHSKM